FRNIGEIEALAGCDRLTISPQLLQELENDNGVLERRLSPDMQGETIAKLQDTEASFRFGANNDPMVTDKLAAGIRNFVKDQINLENQLHPRAQSTRTAPGSRTYHTLRLIDATSPYRAKSPCYERSVGSRRNHRESSRISCTRSLAGFA